MVSRKIEAADLRVMPGRAYPLGAAVRNTGVRFAVFSRHATRVWLAVFEHVGDRTPALELEYDPLKHRIGDVWSMFVEGLAAGVLYLYRMDGPFAPDQGHRFDAAQYLLDPYAKQIVGNVENGIAKCVAGDEHPDWVEDVRPRLPLGDLIIYETHVRGFTVHPSSGVRRRGQYGGVVDKIPYLKDLGVNAVELLPIQESGDTRVGRRSVITGNELRDYWGYNTVGFFAPTGRYGSCGGLGEQLDEFREMVSGLHQAGIELILDVVFNHTSEGDERGPTVCFRGIDNVIYYMLDEQGRYRNFSGCGNTLNCNHPFVRDFILDCLRYWVTVMHVDGFRFDLASILGRDTRGRIVENAGLIERIAEDPALRDTRLIAEAWDAGGAYQVGSFGDVRWAEWNGRYRDEVRRYWRGDPGLKGLFATRIAGSADLYQTKGRTPGHSINFITAHDGFTLRDLVSYNRKHNRANGENNEDGLDENFSWNCGIEGETDNPDTNALRLRMQKNYLATLLLSMGIPMMLGGDECGRTQQGNNNAYCQDNEISWYDWSLLDKNKDLFRFCRDLIRLRREYPVFARLTHFDGKPATPDGLPDLAWFGSSGDPMDWDDPSPLIACRIDGAVNGGVTLYLMFNPSLESVSFRVPPGAWRVRIDTAAPSPKDIQRAEDAVLLNGPTDLALDRKSLVVLSTPSQD